MKPGWIDRLAPVAVRPYLRLMRLDRPIGIWLRLFPAWWAITLAGDGRPHLGMMALFVVEAILSRGLGCTLNDILDRKIDAQVERTQSRPLASHQLTVRQSVVWLILQIVLSLGLLATINSLVLALFASSLVLAAFYPLMKRITWWPQVWLGLTFNWGALVAAAAVRGTFAPPDFMLYAALIFWTLGYDTIYALQDREDDALIGVKSTARRFGSKVRPAVTVIYLICALLAAAAGWLAHGWIGAAVTLPFALHLAQQAYRLVPEDGQLALALFKANREAGLLLFAGWAFIAALI
jgi:4-hydroxybenzoate polyprenyltransferase